jgi:hypothetical protein
MKKVYYRGALLGVMLGLRQSVQSRWLLWLRYPIALVLFSVWAVLMPVACVFVFVGEVGHRIAYFCGFDSSDWWSA